MNVLTRPSLAESQLATRLRRNIAGEVLFHPADRGRYATDASIYQVMPVGVVVPKSIEDVQAAMTLAREEGVSVLARGGGTSQCGQTVNSGLVLDCSKHLRAVVSVEGDVARVQPGITLGALNEALKPHGKFFPVDPSTWARCTIGGMAGNNSCGSKSIRYGLMADNTLGIDALLADGSRHFFGEGAPNTGLVDRLHALGELEAAEIAERFPAQLRRVGGYNLDALTPEGRAAGRGNLSPCSPEWLPLYSRTRSKHLSAIARIFRTSPPSFMFRTGRTCRQPTEAWAYQVPFTPYSSNTPVSRSV